MIKNYVRPDSLEQALNLLTSDLSSYPLAGGSLLSQSEEEYSVVDLQNCGLDYIKTSLTHTHIGAMTRLETIRNHFGKFADLADVLAVEAARNVREQATIGGTLFSSTGRSPFLTFLLGLDAELVFLPDSNRVRIGNWLADNRSTKSGRLLTEVVLDSKVFSKFESIGRSPLDIPIVCTQLSIWSSNRMRLAVGGFGKDPVLILDGNVDDNLEVAIDSALSACKDEWASAEYRIDAVKTLAKRSFTGLIAEKEQK